MLNLNLERLGVTKEALTETILSELDLSREEAVVALAKELGVSIMDARDYTPEPVVAEPTPIHSGEIVATSAGDAEAVVIDGDLASIKSAINVLYGRFCA